VVSPRYARDALWAAEQALASGAPGMVVCWGARADARQVRRLQVAAASSGTLAFLFRSVRAKNESSAASLRLLLLSGARGRLDVDVLKRRGPPCARRLQLEIPRPVKWRDGHESALARSPSAGSAARSERAAALA